MTRLLWQSMGAHIYAATKQPVKLPEAGLLSILAPKHIRITRLASVALFFQKVYAFYLADGFVPLDEDQYPVVEYVRTHFKKTYETEFFELYE